MGFCYSHDPKKDAILNKAKNLIVPKPSKIREGAAVAAGELT